MSWALDAIAVVGAALVGAIPLSPLLVRPLVTHRRLVVRGLAKVLIWGLFWLTFNWSCFAIWGAAHSLVDLTFWQGAALFVLVQIPAGTASYYVVYG